MLIHINPYLVISDGLFDSRLQTIILHLCATGSVVFGDYVKCSESDATAFTSLMSTLWPGAKIGSLTCCTTDLCNTPNSE